VLGASRVQHNRVTKACLLSDATYVFDSTLGTSSWVKLPIAKRCSATVCMRFQLRKRAAFDEAKVVYDHRKNGNIIEL
jgi:hypothetical protein